MKFNFRAQKSGVRSERDMNEIICPHCDKVFRIDEDG
jgi:uncharacterized C2H2 Zn-finger protein